MKTIDFTKPGGFPLTQDRLKYLQQAYTELFGAMGLLAAPANIPIVVSGMVFSAVGPTTSISAGWFFYNGELIYFPGNSISSSVGAGNAVYVVLSTTATPLTYNDGSTPDVILETTAAMAILVNTTPTDATHAPWSTAVSFGQGFGATFRDSAWKSFAVATGSGNGTITGTVYYKKDATANTLHLRGVLASTTPTDFAAAPGTTYQVMGTLPAGYRPATLATFMAINEIAGMVLGEDGVTYFDTIRCIVNTSGALEMVWRLPDASVLGYGMQFNVIIPLD